MTRIEDLHQSHGKGYELVVKVIGTLTGFKIFEDSSNTHWNFFKKTVTVVCYVTFAAWSLISVFDGDDADTILPALAIVSMGIQYLPKLYLLLFKPKVFAELIASIDEVWPSTSRLSPEYLEEFNNSLRQSSTFFTGVLLFSGMQSILIQSYGLYKTLWAKFLNPNVKYTFPFEFCYPRETDSLLVFVIIFAIQWSGCVMNGMGIWDGVGCLFGTIVSSVSRLFIVVQSDLKNIVKARGDDAPRSVEETEEDYNKLKAVVVYHQRVLKIADALNSMCTVLVFLDVTFTALAIGIYGFRTTTMKDSATKLINFFSGLYVLQITLIWSWTGQLLADASAEVAIAAHSCLWYTGDARFRRLIGIIMIRSQSPVYLTSLGFSRVTLQTFVKIMSTAYSYISLFSQVYE
uniref:Odorant receptor n=1 Tax=Cnaphalocrocis medinalis TaxID=437488 RepID=A0A1B2G2P4_CNAME|nr:olfactory receptor 45 [Cnaphalocrocis medinalis]